MDENLVFFGNLAGFGLMLVWPIWVFFYVSFPKEIEKNVRRALKEDSADMAADQVEYLDASSPVRRAFFSVCEAVRSGVRNRDMLRMVVSEDVESPRKTYLRHLGWSVPSALAILFLTGYLDHWWSSGIVKTGLVLAPVPLVALIAATFQFRSLLRRTALFIYDIVESAASGRLDEESVERVYKRDIWDRL